MKALSASAALIVIIALGLGLGFQTLYPEVELSADLLGLFVFVAMLLRLLGAKAWRLFGTARKPAGKEETK